MNKKNLKRSLLFIILAVSGSFLLMNIPLGNYAPDIHLETLDGKSISLNSLRGKPTLLTFWATDCPGCIKEIPHLKKLHHDFSDDGLTVIAVAMSFDKASNVTAMTQEKQLPYVIALDSQGSAAKAFGDVRLTPTNFLIAPDGRIALHKIGEFDVSNMRARIQSYLGDS